MKNSTIKSIIFIIVVVAIGWLLISKYKKPAVIPPPDQTQTPPVTSDLPQVYSNASMGFSIHLPTDYTPSEYKYELLGPGKEIAGVKFTIPSSLAKDTNLSSDSYISVEEIPQATECDAPLFISAGATMKIITDNGIEYSAAITNGAAAGNRYDEAVFAIIDTNPCTAVRYFIHYTAFENYPEGTVTRFDEASLLATFDQIRRSLVVNQ